MEGYDLAVLTFIYEFGDTVNEWQKFQMINLSCDNVLSKSYLSISTKKDFLKKKDLLENWTRIQIIWLIPQEPEACAFQRSSLPSVPHGKLLWNCREFQRHYVIGQEKDVLIKGFFLIFQWNDKSLGMLKADPSLTVKFCIIMQNK